MLAPAGDHRGTGMVERLIQTIKRRLAVLDIDSKWTQTTLSQRVANIIENIRLIPNATTKTSPFEAHFGRKPNTEISNIITKPSHKNLTYKKLRSICLDKKILKHDVLTNEEMWRYDGLSEDNLDIAYKEPENPTPISIDSDESDNMPLRPRSPRKITPSEIHFTIGDKTTKLVVNKRNVAKKIITRKTKEPRPTPAPQWNIIPDGTITNYTPHTITVDTPLRKNTVIRKSDIAIATETKPRLIHMVACKTVGEYKRNQEKIRKFCLEEARNNASSNQQQNQGPSAESIWTKEKVKKLAQANQQQQQRTPKKKSTTKATEQVQMDTTEDTATENETIHMDQNIGDSIIVEDQLKPPSVIFLDSPNGDPEGAGNNPSQLPHSTSELDNEENQANPPTTQAVTSKAPTATTTLYITSCDSPSGTSSVYATTPMSPYKRENSDSCTTDV